MYDVIDMPWDWPVDVNYHEAKAFCKWKGPEYRLPTEAEHNRIRGDPVQKSLSYNHYIYDIFPSDFHYISMYFILFRHLLLIFCVIQCTGWTQMLISSLNMDHLMFVFPITTLYCDVFQ